MTTTLFPSDTQIYPLELTVIPLGFIMVDSNTTKINNDPDLDRLAKLCRIDRGMHRKGAIVY